MPELRPRDHQLYADLERTFSGQPFLLGPDSWVSFNPKAVHPRLATLPGDETSISRLVASGKIAELAPVKKKRQFIIKRDQQ